MDVRAKSILMNSAITVGLFIEYWKGSPFRSIVITGILLFVIANVVMFLSAKKRVAKN